MPEQETENPCVRFSAELLFVQYCSFVLCQTSSTAPQRSIIVCEWPLWPS